MESDRSRFSSLSKQVCQLVSAALDSDAKIHHVLDELNALDYSVKFVESQGAKLLLCHLLQLVCRSKSEHVTSKWCLLVSSIVSKQPIIIDAPLLHQYVEYTLEMLKKCSSWVHSDLLMLLSSLMYKNVGCLEKFWDVLINAEYGVLVELAKGASSTEGDIRSWALKCLQHLTMKSANPGEPYLDEELALNCFNVFLSTLKDPHIESDSITQCKVYLSCLRGLGNIIGCLRCCPEECLGEVLAVLKITAQKRKTRRKRASRRKGTHKEAQHHEEFDQLLSSANTIWEDGFNLTKDNNEIVWSPSASSDSEYSDIDSAAAAASKVHLLHSKVRRNAFNAFQTVVKVVPKRTMFGYWSAFLPDSPSLESPPQWQTILTSVLKDPSPKVRTAALASLAELLDDSKQFLWLAEERACPSTSFTPVSAMLASTIKELHRCLLLALLAESSNLITIQHLKCISILVSNVPYHRLQEGLLSRLFKHLFPLLQHKDMQVRVSCLNIIGCILAVRPALPEVTKMFSGAIKETDSDGSISGCTAEKSDLPWIVRLCCENVTHTSNKEVSGDQYQVSLSVRLESLQVLAIFAENHFDLIRCHLNVILDLLQKIFDNEDPIVQQHGAKVLYSCGKAVNESLASECPEVCLQNGVQFWDCLLGGSFAKATSSSALPSLQAICCDCLSTVSSIVFEALPMKTQMLCLTLVLGLAKDSDPPVRGSAIRCLGVFSLYPVLSEDIGFLMDVGECAISGMTDSQFVVRFKSVWALGNLTDTLLNNREKEDFCCALPSSFLVALLRVAAQSADKDHDKIRCHAVRALGNLIRFISLDMLANEDLKQIICSACHTLCTSLSASLMKVQWNACYALANVLRNAPLMQYSNSFTSGALDVEEIFKSLLVILKSSRNFKVRINAVAALSSVQDRETYSHHFLDVWLGFLEALRTSYNAAAEFAEIKHRDNLCDQLCLGIISLASVLLTDDVAFLATPTLQSQELLQSQCTRLTTKFGTRLTTKFGTEKELDDHKVLLEQVHSHLESLHLVCDIENECVDLLKSIAQQLLTNL